MPGYSGLVRKPLRVKQRLEFALRFGLVGIGGLSAEGFTCFPALLGGFYALDAAPASCALGLDLAHFRLRMMLPAMVAVEGVSHQ